MKIFISYRRDDSAGYAGRLFDILSARFGPGSVFMDIDTIQPGDDFRAVVKNAVGTCDVVLVMIGKQWLTIAGEQGRRLDDPRDWVRVEIASALANPNVRVIPVLVRGAHMPGESQLPDSLKELSWRNALELSDTRFQHDANRLIEAIEQAAGKQPKAPAATPARRDGGRRWAVVIGAVLACLVLALAGGYGYIRSLAPGLPTPGVEFTPTETAAATLTPTLFQAAVMLETDTPSIPTPTSTPEVIPPAADAVSYYYAQVSADNFETTWGLLSDTYKAVHNATGFDPYRAYWSTVDQVAITNLSTIADDGRNATILTDLVFYYLDGRVIPINGYEIRLVYDPSRRTWLINETP